MKNLIFIIVYNACIVYFLIYNYSQNKYKSCIVIRISDATNQQIIRYLTWKKQFPIHFHFYLLSLKRTYYSLLNKSGIKIINIKFKDIVMSYPNIFKLNGNCKHFKSFKLLSWISHSESLILFYKRLKIKYRYIWIIEQDVGFVGNLFKMISVYKNNIADLITIGAGRMNDKWVWFNCATVNYLKRRKQNFIENYGYTNREYIQRWSQLYIRKMMQDLEYSYHSQTESSTIELVFYHNLSYQLINQKYLGLPLGSGKSITQESWKFISNNKNNSYKFFHPLKF